MKERRKMEKGQDKNKEWRPIGKIGRIKCSKGDGMEKGQDKVKERRRNRKGTG